MSEPKYSDYIKDMGNCIVDAVVNGTFFNKTNNNRTHVKKHVADKKESDVLDRVLKNNGSMHRGQRSDKDQKAINSGFYSYDDACSVIEECMVSRNLEIAQWINGARQGQKQSFDMILSSEDGYDPVGYGYVLDREDNTIAEYSTNAVKVVLQKNDECALGFTVLTAYPDITKEENRQPTGRNITDILKKTKTYQDASPTSKAYMLYQTNMESPYLATFKEGRAGNIHDDVMSIHIPYKTSKGEDCKQIIRIKEGTIELSTNKMSDVKIAKKRIEGRPIEKVLQAKTPEEMTDAIKSFQDRGYSIEDGKRYVKVDSFYTKHFGAVSEKSKSVDLTRPDVFVAFRKRNPEAADIVLQSCDAMGIKRPDRYEKAKTPEKLNEGLSPVETKDKTNELSVV